MLRTIMNRCALLTLFLVSGFAGGAEQVQRFLQTFELVPVHLNGASEEYTLIAPRVRILKYAAAGGKFVVLPMVGVCFALELKGVRVNWDALTQLTVGCSAIMGTQALAFNAVSEPVIVLTPPEQLYTELKNGQALEYYELTDLHWGDKKRLMHAIKGRPLTVSNDGKKVLVQRFNLNGEWKEKLGKLFFAVDEFHGLTDEGEMVLIRDTSCGGMVSGLLSALW